MGTPDAGLLVKLMLVHRSISDWTGMIDVSDVMPASLARQVPIREERAFAYNRRSRRPPMSATRPLPRRTAAVR